MEKNILSVEVHLCNIGNRPQAETLLVLKEYLLFPLLHGEVSSNGFSNSAVSNVA